MKSLTKENIGREELVERLKKEAVLQNLGRLMTIFMNLYAKKEVLKKLGKREGQEIQMNFPTYNPPLENPCLTFVLSETPSDPIMGPSENPVLTVTYNMTQDEFFSTMQKMITKKRLIGLLGYMLKSMIKRKMKSKGSLRVSLLFAKLFLIGDHPIFNQDI